MTPTIDARQERRVRTVLLALLLTLVCLGTTLTSASSAQAYSQQYCNVLLPAGYECLSSGLHSVDYNSAAASVGFVCQYIWNAHNHKRRGDYTSCDVNFTSRDWGATANAWYNGRVINGDISSFVEIGYEIA